MAMKPMANVRGLPAEMGTASSSSGRGSVGASSLRGVLVGAGVLAAATTTGGRQRGARKEGQDDGTESAWEHALDPTTPKGHNGTGGRASRHGFGAVVRSRGAKAAYTAWQRALAGH